MRRLLLVVVIATLTLLVGCSVEPAPTEQTGPETGLSSGDDLDLGAGAVDEPVDAPPEADEDVPEAVDVAEGTYGSDPALDALQDACELGDSEACNDLYWQSPAGSEYEATAQRYLVDDLEDAGAEPDFSMSQDNAVSKAQEYLDYSAFSRSGLVEQLEYEGFDNADASFAVDQIGADWSEQAALKAQEYLDYTSFSRSGLVEQLVYEGFTPEQAEYGVSQTGLS